MAFCSFPYSSSQGFSLNPSDSYSSLSKQHPSTDSFSVTPANALLSSSSSSSSSLPSTPSQHSRHSPGGSQVVLPPFTSTLTGKTQQHAAQRWKHRLSDDPLGKSCNTSTTTSTTTTKKTITTTTTPTPTTTTYRTRTKQGPGHGYKGDTIGTDSDSTDYSENTNNFNSNSYITVVMDNANDENFYNRRKLRNDTADPLMKDILHNNNSNNNNTVIHSENNKSIHTDNNNNNKNNNTDNTSDLNGSPNIYSSVTTDQVTVADIDNTDGFAQQQQQQQQQNSYTMKSNDDQHSQQQQQQQQNLTSLQTDLHDQFYSPPSQPALPPLPIKLKRHIVVELELPLGVLLQEEIIPIRPKRKKQESSSSNLYQTEIIVKEVDKGGHADLAGIRVGDKLLAVSQVFGDSMWEVAKAASFSNVLSTIRSRFGSTMKLLIEREYRVPIKNPPLEDLINSRKISGTMFKDNNPSDSSVSSELFSPVKESSSVRPDTPSSKMLLDFLMYLYIHIRDDDNFQMQGTDTVNDVLSTMSSKRKTIVRKKGGCHHTPQAKKRVLHALLHACAQQIRFFGKKAGTDITDTAALIKIDHIYYKLKAEDIPLNSLFLNNLMSAYIDCKAYSRAISVFLDLKDPNIACFTTLIKAYTKSKELDNALKVPSMMRVAGVEPNVKTYNALLTSCTTNDNYWIVEDVFSEMQVFGIEPNTTTYNILINYFATKKAVPNRLQAVEKLFQDMKQQKLVPDCVTYTSVMKAAATSGDMAFAEKIYREMKNFGVRPDITTYNTLLKGYGTVLKYKDALRIFDQLRADKNVKPDLMTFSLIIRACSRAGNVERGDLLFKTMKDMNIQPNSWIYTLILDMYAEKGLYRKAFSVLREMKNNGLQQNIRSISACMHACVVAGEADLAISVFYKATSSGISPDTVLYTLLIRAYGIKADLTKSFRVLQIMEKSGNRVNEVTYNTLIESCIACANLNEVLKALELHLASHKNSKTKPPISGTMYRALTLVMSSSYNGPMKDCLEYLLNVVQLLKKYAIQPRGPIYKALLETCLIVGNAKVAYQLVEEKSRTFEFSAREKAEINDLERRVFAILGNP